MRKISVLLIFGGKSAEHEISLISAGNIASGLSRKKYKIIPTYVSKSGIWIGGSIAAAILRTRKVPTQRELKTAEKISFVLGESAVRLGKASKKIVDVAFPVLHGPNGEDGSMQGLLQVAGISYVGAGVLGSAVGMDKDAMKRLLNEARVPITPYQTVRKGEKIMYGDIQKQFGTPVFIKPANMGSSIGVSKANSKKEFYTGLKAAFCFDTKVIIEKAVVGKEVECAILGNDKVRASSIGEIAPTHEFYSYNAKYIDESGAQLFAPARISSAVAKKVQDIAIRAYKALDCQGMGRVDCFLTADGEVLVNEINTIPGFTSISMYPKLWNISGISTEKLLDELIRLALIRGKAQMRLKHQQ
jgi:D-alanine-D-alanine ligase